MDTLTHFRTLLRHPSIIRPYRPIILLSHMRANTSLLGHLLASNPSIEGYYEMHIGYYSWKSLLRQKLMYFAEHQPKTTGHFLFDNVLHDDHYVNLQLFSRGKVIFSLRSPDKAIKSIVSLYREIEPDHDYVDSRHATSYYIKRLASLAAIARSSPVDFMYLDADALREDTKEALTVLSQFIGLEQPIDEHYAVQPLTGSKRVGDSSESITAGTVKKITRNYDDINVADDLMTDAWAQYTLTRQSILGHARCKAKALLND